MLKLAANRRAVLWLTRLFFMAQVFGVVSLMSEHTTHVASTELSFHNHAGDVPHTRHHRGDADGFVQHHELQDLSGALICPIGRCEIAAMPASLIAPAPEALAEADPTLLERPPKTALSV